MLLSTGACTQSCFRPGLERRYRYRARKQAADLWDGCLLTRAVAVPISRVLI